MVLRPSSMLGFWALALFLPGLASSQNATQIQNPILPGFHPDPSCTFIPEDESFYCASSSFNAFPGIPIHASKNLTTWRLVGNVLNRESQLPELATSVGGTSGIWAPTLRKRDGVWYLVTTMVHDKKAADDPTRWRNIIFSTRDIWNDSSWSDAVHFDFEGYDTSPFWDDDGTEYIVGSHAYKVEPGNHLAKVNLTTGEVQSNWTNLWSGTGGLAPEGPHLYRKDGYYYLMIAEGGTGINHMETIARSKNLLGPYEPNPANPILTNANTTEYFQCVGHADFFQDSHGAWWTVALATRSGPAFKDYPMGRETVLTNATWEEGAWPVIQNPVRGAMNGWTLSQNQTLPGNGPLVDQGDNITFGPSFTFPPQFTFWRPPVKENHILPSPNSSHSYLRLKPSALNLTGLDGNSAPGGQTFIGRRQVHTRFTYRVQLSYQPQAAKEEAGVAVFLTQNHHARFGITLLPSNGTSNSTAPHIRFTTEPSHPAAPSFSVPLPSHLSTDNDLNFEIKAVNETHYSFALGRADEEMPVVYAYAPAEIVSWGFTGALVGVYATANGGEGNEVAEVKKWEYWGEEQVRD